MDRMAPCAMEIARLGVACACEKRVSRGTGGRFRLARFTQGSKSTINLLVAAFAALSALFAAPEALARRFEVPQFLVVDYHAISKTRVGDSPDHKPLYDYVYRVDVRNSGARAASVIGEVTSKRSSVLVIDGAVTFGAVDHLEIKTSEDTITIRAGKFFDRRLDRKIQSNGRWRFEEEGTDPDDASTFGLLQRSTRWYPELLDAIYNLKFALIFDWRIRSQPDATAPVISNTAPVGLLREAQPLITAAYADPGGSVATAQVVLTVDSVDVTAQATVGPDSIAYRPTTALGQGAHSVNLRVPDHAGNVANASWTFTVDSQPPAITNPSPIDTLSASPNATISASYDDAVSGIDLTQVRLTVDGQDVTALASVTAASVLFSPPAPLADGQHQVTLALADAAGNPASMQWTFGIDASGPQIADLSPANGAELAADAVPFVAATFVDGGSGLDVSTVRLSVDGIDVTSQAQVTAESVSYTPSAPLPEGHHAIEFSARDRNGNASTSSWSFVTRTAPEILDPQPNNTILNAAATVTISAQYRDVGSGIDAASVRLSIDGVDFTAEAQVSATEITLTPAVALPQGLHIVALSVSDLAGNTTASQWRFTIDTSLPYVEEQRPRNTLVATATPTITAVYADSSEGAGASGIDHARTRLYVNEVDVTRAAQVDSSVTPHRISYTPPGALPQGSTAVRLIVADRAGNEIESSWHFTIDIEGPAIADLAPADGATFAADALITLSGSFVDAGSGIDVASVRIELDGQDITAQASVGAAGFERVFAQPLSEGSHSVRVTVRDLAGNETSRESGFLTMSAPVIDMQSPRDEFLPGDAQPTITARLSDIGAGIDVTSVRMYFNGIEVTGDCQITATSIAYAVRAPLADATHAVRVRVADLSGNVTESAWQFASTAAPEITSTSPRDVVLPPGSRPTITASYQDLRVGVDPRTVRLLFNSVEVTAAATVTSTGVSYTPPQPLAADTYTVHLLIDNQTNGGASAIWGFDVEAEQSYEVEITAPAATVEEPRVEVTATAYSNKPFEAGLTVNGMTMQRIVVSDSGRHVYAATVELRDGSNALEVRASFDSGEVRTATRHVFYDAPPRVTVTGPADRTVFGRVNPTSPGDLTGNVERPVTITGLVTKPVTSVRINQQAAQLLAGGTEFRFENFFLHEGLNVITAVATDAVGRTGSAAITLSVDQSAPILTVESPVDQWVTSVSAIDVRGMVNDAVEGFIGAPEPTVSVNGRVAQVSDRYYLATDVPLQIGANDIEIVASDQFGNARSVNIRVSRVAVGADRLTLLSGNHQSGPAVSELPEPLRVVALSAAGEPLANLPVTFDVVRGTGTVSAAPRQPVPGHGTPTTRNLIIRTDASGMAQAWFTLGKQSGPGANVVIARNDTTSEDVTFVGTTRRGAVSKVLADTGINQFAETRSQPLELLSLVVRDREDNPLPNVPVVFKIDQGDAYFTAANGNPSDTAQVLTDKNGVTAVRPTLGSAAGLVRVVARALREENGDIHDPADLTGSATYLIQVKEARNGPASFKGFLYTDKGEPLPGVRISIGRTALSATSDSTGMFEFTEVPAGRIDLFIDGRTSNHQQKVWPSLHFESYVVRGQQNQLPHPIYLPPLMMSEAKIVGGNEDVILQIPGVQGFQMKVKANSVTFPDGSRTGTLVVSPVTADRLPMSPPAGGAIFGVPAWTIQPAGTRFDPPIEVQFPNSSAQPPGDNLPVVQWDHDLGQFVPMGRATVAESGAYLVTDAGSGITKAGWGGLCVYDPDKCAKKEPTCTECELLDASGECPKCKPDPEKDGLRTSGTDLNMVVSWEPGSKKLFENTLAKKITRLGGLEVSVKGKIGGALRESSICCVNARGGDTISSMLVLAGDIELELKWNWLKGSELATLLTGPDTKLGAFTKIKFFGGIGTSAGDLIWNDCQRRGTGNIGYLFGLAVSVLDTGLKTQAPINGQPTDVEFTLLDAGGNGGWTGTLHAVDARTVRDRGRWFYGVFFKVGEYKFGNFKFTLVNLSWNDLGTIDDVSTIAVQ